MKRYALRTALENLAVVGALALAALLIGNLIAFATSRNRLPPQTRINDLNVGDMTVDEALLRLNTIMRTPITVRLVDDAETLLPTAIQFQVNEVALRVQLQALVERHSRMDAFPAFALRRNAEPIVIEPRYQYDAAQLEALVRALAERIDRPPRPMSADLDANVLRPGEDGLTLDQAAASAAILAAFASAQQRTVDLPIYSVPAAMPPTAWLQSPLEQRLSAFFSTPSRLAAVFVKDLRTGEEFSLNADVALSAQGWLRIALALYAYHALPYPLSAETAAQVRALLAQDDADAERALLTALGEGDPQRALLAFNRWLAQIGLRNTFLAALPDDAAPMFTAITPANARGDVSANPSPRAQSTAAEVGLLLEMIQQCAENQGPLRLLFEDSLEPSACAEVMTALARTPASGLLAQGNVPVFGRTTWDENNHGDAALARAGEHPWVMVVLLHDKAPLDGRESATLIGDASRLCHAAFLGQLPALALPPELPR
ncbi:MAG: serine hydrolase [Anaerolineae bacterium]|nr:serine hydrolase [Anaerolineae bacterium]